MIFGSAAATFIQSRRLPSEIRLTEAQAEKAQHEASALIIKDLRDEVDRLKARILDFDSRLSKSEARATNAESRLADAEIRASEFRRAVIAIGERLDKERAKSRDVVVNLVGIIEHLLDCVENPDQAASVDRPAIARLTQQILDDYPIERFLQV